MCSFLSDLESDYDLVLQVTCHLDVTKTMVHNLDMYTEEILSIFKLGFVGVF